MARMVSLSHRMNGNLNGLFLDSLASLPRREGGAFNYLLHPDLLANPPHTETTCRLTRLQLDCLANLLREMSGEINNHNLLRRLLSSLLRTDVGCRLLLLRLLKCPAELPCRMNGMFRSVFRNILASLLPFKSGKTFLLVLQQSL